MGARSLGADMAGGGDIGADWAAIGAGAEGAAATGAEDGGSTGAETVGAAGADAGFSAGAGVGAGADSAGAFRAAEA